MPAGRASAGRPAEGAEFYVQGTGPHPVHSGRDPKGAQAAGFPFSCEAGGRLSSPDPGSESSPQPRH